MVVLGRVGIFFYLFYYVCLHLTILLLLLYTNAIMWLNEI